MPTVNIQHLESLNDVIERITGVRQRETIPDDVVRPARSARSARPYSAQGSGIGPRSPAVTRASAGPMQIAV
nr:hypothetical protein [Yinghuangia sp. ASG 101]